METPPHRPMKHTLKVLLIGDSGVGKTSLMNRFSTGNFTGQYKATIGADFLSKEVVVTMPQTGERKMCSLQIWDTAGQERFQSLGQGFYRGADACILVYDATNPDSFDNLEHWRCDFLDQVGGSMSNLTQLFPFVVLGNKIDKFNHRLVSHSKAEQWCAQASGGLGIENASSLPHFETSAKTAINVDEAFSQAAILALLYAERKRLAQPQLFVPPAQHLDLSRNSNNTSEMRNGCC